MKKTNSANIDMMKLLKQLFKLILVWMFLFGLPFGLTAQTVPEVDLESLEFPELNPYQIPEIETFELDNGIKFYLVEDHEVPLINMNLIVRAGSFMDSNDKVGLAGITANVMRNGGSETFPEDELNQLLEDRAARLEFGMGFVQGSGSLNALKEDFIDLLPVFKDVMMNPLLPQDKIDLAITQRRTSIARRNDNPQQIAFRVFEELIYGEGSPQARIIEHHTLDAITRDDLVAFHDNAFKGENLMIGLVGDFDTDEMKGILEDVFADIPAGTRNEIDLPEVNYDFESSIHFVDKRDVNQSVVLMGHIGGLRDNPDYAALQTMNEVLSGGFTGRLFRNVRSEQGLAYSVFGAYGSNATYPGQFYAGIFTQSSNTAAAIDAVRYEMERLQNEPVSQQELDDTRDSILNSLVFRYDSRSRILSERMSYEYLGLPIDSFDRYIEELQSIEPEDIQRVAQQYMRPGDMKILVVGNGEEIGDQLEKYGVVNEFDITIPLPGDDEETEAVAGDSEAGRAWMDHMTNAIFPNGIPEGDFVFEGENVVQSPMGEISMGIKQTVNFKEDKLIAEVNAPMGQITMQVIDGQGAMFVGGNEIPMQPAQRDEMLNEHYRNPLYLVINREELDVQYMGSAEMDGRYLEHLTVRGNQTLQIYLDPETSLPAVLTFRQFDPESGQMITLRQVSKDWTESAGVLMPYSTTTYSGEEAVSVMQLESHTVE